MRKAKKKIWIFILAMVILAAYFVSGIYSLQSGQRALILRFGRVMDEVTDSGIHYHLPPPFEKGIKVHISKVQKVAIHKSVDESVFDESIAGDSLEGFTGDENLILVRAFISYDVKNLTHYLFNVEDVKSVVKSSGQMCLGQELAKITVDDVMTSGKSLLRLMMKEKVQKVLDELQTGVRVISVELTDISPPLKVSPAFKAVSDAREKKQGIIKKAEGYANSVIPKSRGNASSIIAQAEAYAKEIENLANGEVKAFYNLLTEYERNPGITVKLKYLETIKQIFSQSQVTIDANPALSTYYIGKKEKKIKSEN
jgi:membrane protease subunit HflK